MNWVEQEFFAVAEVDNPDVWLLSAPIYKACDHRWRERPNPVHPMVRGFYRPNTICVCRRCGAEA